MEQVVVLNLPKNALLFAYLSTFRLAFSVFRNFAYWGHRWGGSEASLMQVNAFSGAYPNSFQLCRPESSTIATCTLFISEVIGSRAGKSMQLVIALAVEGDAVASLPWSTPKSV